MDVFLANRVRSGRKQPQRVLARVVSSLPLNHPGSACSEIQALTESHDLL